MASPLYAQISERVFTQQVIDLARWSGWLCCHIRPGMNRRGKWSTAYQGDSGGFPDLVLIKAGRDPIFAELKTAKGKVTVNQRKWLETAKAAGIRAVIWRPADIERIEEILK